MMIFVKVAELYLTIHLNIYFNQNKQCKHIYLGPLILYVHHFVLPQGYVRNGYIG